MSAESMSGMCRCGCGRQLSPLQVRRDVKFASRACYDGSRNKLATPVAPPMTPADVAFTRCLACNSTPTHRIFMNLRDGLMHMIDCQVCGRSATAGSLLDAVLIWQAYSGAEASTTQVPFSSQRASHLPAARGKV